MGCLCPFHHSGNIISKHCWIFVCEFVVPEYQPIFCKTWSFITIFTRPSYWLLSRARWIQSTPSYPIFMKSILLLSSHLCPKYSKWSFFGFLYQNILCMSLFFHMCCMPCTPHSLLDHPNNIWEGVQILRLLIM
jgi:hypothetical protein